MNATDDQSIRRVIVGYETAWNTHDMRALAGLFHEDAEWVNVVGMYWRGKDALVTAHATFHDTIFKNCELHSIELSVRDVGVDTAIAVWTVKQDAYTAPDGSLYPESNTRLSVVLTRRQGQWLISHAHNVRINENAARFDPANSKRQRSGIERQGGAECLLRSDTHPARTSRRRSRPD